MTERPDAGRREELGAALAHEIEGHLLAAAHRDAARREASALCARLPWLTAAQAEDVSHHYMQQRLDVTRMMLRVLTDRAEQLRHEYETRYAALRRTLLKRHAAAACALLAGLGAGGTVLWLALERTG
ncbi:hypothetical protein [Streptomyces viridochromogenes]|uniref:Putative membrane protein n=1 Tax=Streptomyces viridochromogenes Tue57 TaxID=1160705 RepID=L8P697_STRVR|nr:hypothetical protein [Streptomyces viridochromogenes]ELS50857.1 putative membrane protein [Streptomyces viridochromogenes Tue57]